jgi:hypothetical protein
MSFPRYFVAASTVVVLLMASTVDAFSTVSPTATAPRVISSLPKSSHQMPFATTTTTLFMANEQRDVSRSGTRKERLNRLAELEKDRVDTDKGFVVKAAGGFVGLLLILVLIGVTVYGPAY